MIYDSVILFGAGLLGGVLNSIAGGGSFVTFPALLFVGVAPISANATNTFASCAGYLSGAYALRNDIFECSKQLPRLVVISLMGGVVGAWLLIQTPDDLFREAIPWLLLFATLLFVFGGKLNTTLKRFAAHHQRSLPIGSLLLTVLLLGVCIYGGFFNAGLGIVTLSYLALAGYSNINAMNGLKLLVSSSVSLIAIIVFIYEDSIAWYEGGVVLLGTFVGGYVAANFSRQLPQRYVRTFVIFAGSGMSVYFFFEIYA